LEDLIKVIGHEAMSLANYNRFGMFSNIAIETTSIWIYNNLRQKKSNKLVNLSSQSLE